MSLNIANVDKLLAFMRALPPEHFGMHSSRRPSCDTPGCVAGCIATLASIDDDSGLHFVHAEQWLGADLGVGDKSLFCPPGWNRSRETGDFPLARAIDVVQHLRDTGEVDWSRFPAENYRNPPTAPKPAWTPPVVIAVEPELPESLTGLLRLPVEVARVG